MLSKKKPQDKVDPEYLVGLDTASAQPAPAGVKPFIKKHWKPIVAVVCAAAVAAAVLVPKNSAKPAAASSQYVETRPEKRNIVNSYSADGTITAADTYTVKPMVKGTVLTADFEVGDTVNKGDVLYTIDSSDMASSVEKAQLSLDQAQSSYDDAVDAQYIRSSVRGTVSSLKVKAGDVVSAGQEVAVVRDDSTLLLTLDFPAADAAAYFVGQSVDVTIDGTFETTTGTIQSISGADSLTSGNLAVRSVVIAVQNPGTLNTTMSGTASISGVSAMSSAHFTCQYEQTITAAASGTVAALCVKEGSTVGVDTALIQLSSSSLSKQVKSASNSLRSAEISLDDTQRSMEDYTITSPISGTIIAKDVKVGDTVGSSSSTTETMCVIYDLSYLEMTLDVDELDILDIQVGQKAEITADAISDHTFEGVVTSISSAGTTSGGTTTYPVTIRIDDTGSLMPGMNATAVIDIASAEDALSIPSYAVVRGSYVLVTKDSPSAANADTSMNAPDGYVYVKVTTGVSDDDYIAVTSGLEEGDTIAYDSSTASQSSSDDQMGFPGGGMPGGGGMSGGRGGGGAPGGGF